MHICRHFIKPRNAKVCCMGPVWKAPKAECTTAGLLAPHTPAIACQRAGHAGPALSPLGTLSPRCRERSHCSTRVRRTFYAHARTRGDHCPSLAGGNGFSTAQTQRTSRGTQRARLWAGVDEYWVVRTTPVASTAVHLAPATSPRLRSNRAHHRPRHVRPPSPRSRAWCCAQGTGYPNEPCHEAAEPSRGPGASEARDGAGMQSPISAGLAGRQAHHVGGCAGPDQGRL